MRCNAVVTNTSDWFPSQTNYGPWLQICCDRVLDDDDIEEEEEEEEEL